MTDTLLTKLKTLQLERSNQSPFTTHIELHTWADKVQPLLSFEPKLYSRFKNSASSADSSRHFQLKEQEIENINTAIGVLNQAITSLEISPKPTNNTAEQKLQPSKFKQWLGKVGEKVLITLIAGAVGYVALHYLLPIVM